MLLALDRAPVLSRSFDADGRLRVVGARLSKAAVNPYRGEEIPDWEALGLDPRRMYRLLRDPEELRKAASTFDGVPLLFAHRPLEASDHARELVVGTIGTECKFRSPWLVATIVVWDQDAIDAIESGEQRELSCGYRYVPDMTPGKHEGMQFDGVMRDIVGNHVALVETGRVGSDCSL